MSTRYDVTADADLDPGLTAATTAVRAGELVVLPTDTVYGLGADAFDSAAVARLLAAKGRGREMPPPVLIGSPGTLDALATGLPEWARVLVEQFWPGPLTIVVRHQPSLQWDLGETRGTVAVRMPHHQVALELLARTGPLAVSSANITGRPAAADADEAAEMLGSEVSVILDGGPSAGDQPSTIVDCTGDQPRVLRIGAIGPEELRTVLATLDIALADDTDEGPGEGPDEGPDEGTGEGTDARA
ncbi:threonylcarbamoyl-AMP synthase [Nocardioides marmoriginsengisoli]|uniref:L-threonylcarbamoyladenylate synthase n=1 Tax=Nocardioides marmoriginsengisoli TaxID=661483 RepID=A0A3N0CPM3_9ACTN|nr:L-threonylcarbamoyladenylate synthase [Nocardioides marmoriginsengisoli]RNL65251.1 threonylcarbamoyl-AMP synthase [Nocardioides marmoriginsengisoli]